MRAAITVCSQLSWLRLDVLTLPSACSTLAWQPALSALRIWLSGHAPEAFFKQRMRAQRSLPAASSPGCD